MMNGFFASLGPYFITPFCVAPACCAASPIASHVVLLLQHFKGIVCVCAQFLHFYNFLGLNICFFVGWCF